MLEKKWMNGWSAIDRRSRRTQEMARGRPLLAQSGRSTNTHVSDGAKRRPTLISGHDGSAANRTGTAL
jgi:hypothetical protein